MKSNSKCRRNGGISDFYKAYLLSFVVFSHCWLAIPQLVLQADWQEVWHSPHPPFLALSQRLRVSIVSICFILVTSVKIFYTQVLYHFMSSKSIGKSHKNEIKTASIKLAVCFGVGKETRTLDLQGHNLTL